MPELTRREFADYCCISQNLVGIDARRGKIVEEETAEGRFIDTQNSRNKAYYKKRRIEYLIREGAKKGARTNSAEIKGLRQELRSAEKGLKQELLSTEEGLKQELLSAEEGLKHELFSAEEEARYLEEADWESRKRRADALLQEAKHEKERLIVEKLAGQLIPIDLASEIMQTHNSVIFSTFQNATENLASIYCDILANGNRKKLAELDKKLSERLEDIIRRAKDTSEASIENLVEAYRSTRSRGERN